jgi:hypothetical protein
MPHFVDLRVNFSNKDRTFDSSGLSQHFCRSGTSTSRRRSVSTNCSRSVGLSVPLDPGRRSAAIRCICRRRTSRAAGFRTSHAKRSNDVQPERASYDSIEISSVRCSTISPRRRPMCRVDRTEYQDGQAQRRHWPRLPRHRRDTAYGRRASVARWNIGRAAGCAPGQVSALQKRVSLEPTQLRFTSGIVNSSIVDCLIKPGGSSTSGHQPTR